MIIIKPLGIEVSIASANDVAAAGLVRVINTGALAVLHIANSAGNEYANLTVSNAQMVFVQKANGDLLTGANMKAVPVAYK